MWQPKGMAYGAFCSSSFGDVIPGAFNMLFIEFASKKAPILLIGKSGEPCPLNTLNQPSQAAL